MLLCWLALLLRVVERETGHRWPAVRREMHRLHQITYGGPHGEVSQQTELPAFQEQILAALKLAEPPKFFSRKGSSESTAQLP